MLSSHLFRRFVIVAPLLLLVVAQAGAATLGYWRFEGDATAFLSDSSGNGATLARANSQNGYPVQVTLPASGAGSDFQDPLWRNGLANASAASFGGAGNQGIFTRASDALIVPTAAFTIEAFVNHDQAIRNFIATRWQPVNGRRAWSLEVTATNTLTLMVSSDGNSGASVETLNSSLTVTPGKDYFVAVSFDLAAQQVVFYAQNLTDGGLLLSQTMSHTRTALHTASGTTSFSIGALDPTNNPTDYWRGLIDEVRISDVVLSARQLLVVPEPSSLALLGLSVLALLRRR